MEKTSFLVKDNQVYVNIPISKGNINVEKRLVSGWATIDNVDQTGDVVTAEASLKAFQDFRGNIREMHDKHKAVGKLVNFRQEEFFRQDGTAYTGIWVDVYISKGAEDTWQKILDGTLSGFSVYGPIAERGMSKQYIPESDKTVTFITDYKLIELSLVDSPGNELCNVLEIQKFSDPKGIATQVEIDNVFWCEDDEMAFIAKSETHACGFCKKKLDSLGWFETVEDPTQEVRKILENQDKISKAEAPMEGGQEVSEENVTNEALEVTVDVQEPEVEKINEPSLAGINEALTKIQETLELATVGEQEREAALSKVRAAIEGVEAKVEKQLADLLEKHEKLATEITSIKDRWDGVEKRLETIEGATALRKSQDVDDEGATLSKGNAKKDVWVGSFLPSSFDQ